MKELNLGALLPSSEAGGVPAPTPVELNPNGSGYLAVGNCNPTTGNGSAVLWTIPTSSLP